MDEDGVGNQVLRGHLHLTATTLIFSISVVHSVIVVNSASKWCQSWFTGIKELGLEISYGHPCCDFVFIYEGSTLVVFHDLLQLTWISKSVVRCK